MWQRPRSHGSAETSNAQTAALICPGVHIIPAPKRWAPKWRRPYVTDPFLSPTNSIKALKDMYHYQITQNLIFKEMLSGFKMQLTK